MAYGNYAPFYRPGYFNPAQAPAMPNMIENQNQYMPAYQMPQQPNVQPTPAPMPNLNQTNDIIWVQGEAGAKAYLVAPNNTITLWDSESPTIYLKTADANGVPSMRILDFTERVAGASKTPVEHVCKCGDKFVSKEDYNALKRTVDALSGKLKELEDKCNYLTTKNAPKTAKKTEDE